MQFTETNCPQIGKAVNDALLEHHDLLQPLCYFRIEDQIFEGFLYALEKEFECTYCKAIFYYKEVKTVKNLQMFDLQSLNDLKT